jgi:glutamate synthase (NADPH/NADH) small chain
MKAYDSEHSDTPIFKSKNLAVLGGGNVAMDAARMAKRLGAEHVYVIYRRTENEMPARREEVLHAKEEGIEFCFLQNPTRIMGDESQFVTSIECLKYELGDVDASGRRKPIPIEGSEFSMDIDTVVIAIGNGSNPLLAQSTPELKLNKRGNIVTDENGQTSIPGIFAGGDIVLGAATVILAMGEGRKAATSINKLLTEK